MNKDNLLRRFAIILFILTGTTSIFAAGGDLDTLFAGTGKQRYGFGSGDDSINAAAVQADGKLVVAGLVKSGTIFEFGVVRYNTDGSLDTTFGRGGKFSDMLGYYGDTVARSVKIQTDGKIVVGGNTFQTGVGGVDFAAIRLNADGTLDPTFGSGGRVVVTVGPGVDEANAMAIQTDGKIILAGYSVFPGSFGNCSLIRLDPNGALDTTFDGDGIVVTDLNINGDSVAAILMYGTDILAAGHSFGDFAVIRYNSDGSLDTSFDFDGIAVTSFGPDTDRATGIAIQPGNAGLGVPDRIVVGGFDATPANTNFAAVRYNLNGSLDTSFDGDGLVSFATGNVAGATGLLIQSSGPTTRKVILTGYGGTDIQLAKLNLNGSLDTAFDGDGIVTTSIIAEDYGNTAVFMDGKILVAGMSRTAANAPGDFTTARYDLASGALDTTYNGTGTRLDDVGSYYTALATATAVQPDGKVVVAGKLDDPNSTTNLAGVLRLNSNGSLDTSFSIDGTASASMDDTRAVAIQTDGKIVIAGSFVSGGNRDFGLIRFNADGSNDIFAATPIGPGNATDFGSALAIQTDGKMLVAGSSGGDFALVRFNANGTLDGSFDGDGKIVTDLGTATDAASSVAVMSDDRIVVAGNAGSNFGAARYNPDGSLDTTFSFDGKVTTPLGFSSQATAMKMQPDGKVVVAGYTFDAMVANRLFALVRYNVNGSLDTSFDGDGIVTTQIGTASSFGNAVTIQSDGKIVLAGSTSTSTGSSLAVARYNADGSLDSSFAPRSGLYGTNGVVLIGLTGTFDSADAIALDAFGNAVVAGSGGNLFGVARILDGLGPTASSVAVGGRVTAPDGSGLRNAIVALTNSNGETRQTRTSSLGYFRFDEVTAGETYVIAVGSKRYNFTSRLVSVGEEITNADFVPE